MLKKAILIVFFMLSIVFLRWDAERRFFDRLQINAYCMNTDQLAKPRGRSILRNFHARLSVRNLRERALRILVLHRGGVGEREAAARIKIASRHLGWECYICSLRPTTWEKILFVHPLDKAIRAIQPDFTINFQTTEKRAPGINFVSLSSGVQTYAKESFDWKKYASFDGFLPTFQEIGIFKEKIESLGKSFRGIRWFFTCPSTAYVPLRPKKLFYCGSNWDESRKGKKTKSLFTLLDRTGELAIYGPPKKWKHTPRSYGGFLPFDGISIIKKMQECGIVLVLHSDIHLQGNAPTGRIFEAAAAGCAIISDRHPFIVQEFGDAVLYIDQEGSSEAIFQAIATHMAWIRSHPEKAQEMAFRCHQIFMEKFTLEKQLCDLKEICENIQHPS